MRKIFKPASILFCVLVLLVFFFVGIYAAILTGAGDGQMLASGAIVVGWGMISAVIAFIFALFFAYSFPHKIIVKSNWVLFGLLLVFYAITHYRFVMRQQEQEQRKVEEQKEREQTQPVTRDPVGALGDPEISNFLLTSIQEPEQDEKGQLGIGFFRPNFFRMPTLYFYGGVNLEKGLLEHLPLDSLQFSSKNEMPSRISFAPPWLFPEHLKMDYGILFFKVFGVGYDFVKVEVNKETHQIAYLDKSAGELLDWPEFLLSMNSVEFLESSDGNVYLKPLLHASKIEANFDFMQPLLVEENWMYVRLVDDGMLEKGKGWIQWKMDGELLISYSILS